MATKHLTPSKRIYTKEPSATKIRNLYCRAWSVPYVRGRNPCPLPVSLDRTNLPLLTRENYLVSEKSDGVRYCLFLTEDDGRNQAFFLDRNLALYQIPVAADSTFFRGKGSVFDGELVLMSSSGDTHLVFLVFDVACVKGDDTIRQQNLYRRAEVVRQTFDLEGAVTTSAADASSLARKGKIVSGGNAHSLSFRPKQCFQLDMIDTVLRGASTRPYPSDGLLFTPIHEPMAIGTSQKLFKLKHFHTIDVEIGPEGFLVGCGHDAPEERKNIGDVTEMQVPHTNYEIGSIVECAVKEQDGKYYLEPLHLRTDKKHPNSEFTVLRTINNVKEGITEAELSETIRGIAFKNLENP